MTGIHIFPAEQPWNILDSGLFGGRRRPLSDADRKKRDKAKKIAKASKKRNR